MKVCIKKTKGAVDHFFMHVEEKRKIMIALREAEKFTLSIVFLEYIQ